MFSNVQSLEDDGFTRIAKSTLGSPVKAVVIVQLGQSKPKAIVDMLADELSGCCCELQHVCGETQSRRGKEMPLEMHGPFPVAISDPPGSRHISGPRMGDKTCCVLHLCTVHTFFAMFSALDSTVRQSQCGRAFLAEGCSCRKVTASHLLPCLCNRLVT